MSQGTMPEKDLLEVEEVAAYLGVGKVTIWRWCREGNLPCLKVGRVWRIRREEFEEFLNRTRRSESLAGRLDGFLKVPDNVMAIAQNRELMLRLDAAFFRVGKRRGGTLIKYHKVGTSDVPSAKEVRLELEERDIEVARLEEEGRLHFIGESTPGGERTGELKRLLSEIENEGRSLWVNFNWEEDLDMEEALRQQEEITELVEDSRLVIKTTVLEDVLDEWCGATQRRAQLMHSGTITLAEAGVSLTRVSPPPAL